MEANIELDGGRKTFAGGLLADLIAALRRSRLNSAKSTTPRPSRNTNAKSAES